LNLQSTIDNCSSFKELVEVSFNLLLSRNPVSATLMGIETYNDHWPDITFNGVTQDIQLLKAIHVKLKQLFTNAKIYPEDKPDFLLMSWFIKFSLFELEELQFWKSNPRLTSLIVSGFYSLLVKTHFDQERKVASIITRLNKISHLIESTKSRVTHPVQLWIDAELKACTNAPTFIKSMLFAFISLPKAQSNLLKESIDRALNALNKYEEWLRSLSGSSSLPINKEKFEKLIDLRKLGVTPDDIEDIGSSYLSQTELILEELVEQLPGSTVHEVRDQIRSKHPATFEEVVEKYREIAVAAKAFLWEKDLLTMPDEELQVIFTPPPVRHLLSIAAASPPGRFDQPQRGYFWCTPHDDLNMLKEHSYAYLHLLINHESYPGHHLHGVCKNTHPSLIRTSIFSHPSANLGLMYPSTLAAITEGWGLYCEEMMLNNGFGHDPKKPNLERIFLQVNALRWRATRMILDVQLHTGQISYDEAVAFLQTTTGYNEATCKAEVLMYTQSPGYFSSYLLGKHLLTQLKDELAIPDKAFHDTILYSGSVPFWFLKQFEFNQ
jgi:hypothetical protein